jgi:predicted GIY-YIG superfamily endonuclease
MAVGILDDTDIYRMEPLIYVLKCLNNKYYVGQTRNLVSRYRAHQAGRGSAWTAVHQPTEILETYRLEQFPVARTFQEDAITLSYMSRYGIENVRGGSFSQITLPEELVRCIDKQLVHARGGCFLCGETGHYAKQCDEGEGGAPPTKRRRT